MTSSRTSIANVNIIHTDIMPRILNSATEDALIIMIDTSFYNAGTAFSN